MVFASLALGGLKVGGVAVGGAREGKQEAWQWEGSERAHSKE